MKNISLSKLRIKLTPIIINIPLNIKNSLQNVMFLKIFRPGQQRTFESSSITSFVYI